MHDADGLQDHQIGGTRRWIMLFALLVTTAVLASLSLWQVQRLAWKQELIARADTRAKAQPEAPPPIERWPSINAADDEYKRLQLSGTFRHDLETLVTASTERGPGYWVMTPLAQPDGTTVIVNRGFVTRDRRAPATRGERQTTGPTTVTGLLRVSEARHWILRHNDPVANRWYRRDPADIARARNIDRVAPYFVDAEASSPPQAWPVAGLTRIRFTNNHLVYALTWLALAVFAAIAAGYVLRTDFGLGRSRSVNRHSAASM